MKIYYWWIVCWIILLSRKTLGQHCDKNECFEDDIIIHWDLNGLSYDDPNLINAIKTKVLWPPPKPGSKLNFKNAMTNLMFKGTRPISSFKNEWIETFLDADLNVVTYF